MQKITNEEYKRTIEKLGKGEYTLLSKYDGANNRVMLRHKCGNEYSIIAGDFKRGHGRCAPCLKKEKRKQKLIKFKKDLERLYPGQYTVLSTTYETGHDKLRVKHNVCNQEIDIAPHILLQHPVCSVCHGGIPKTDKEFRAQVKSLVGNEYTFLEPYENSSTKIKCRHNACNFEWDIRPNDFTSKGIRCPKCGDNIPMDESEFKKELKQVWGDTFTVLGKYTKKHGKIKVRCNKCTFEWSPQARRLLEGHGCPECKNHSVGERLVKSYLDNKNIMYKHSFVLPNRLHLDFYLKSLGLAIEYDGIQHYQPREYFGGKTAFEDQIKRDRRKDKYCEDRGITLIRIPYTQNTYERVERFLDSKLGVIKKD